MDHTRRLLLLPLWADGNWFVIFLKVAIVGVLFFFFLSFFAFSIFSFPFFVFVFVFGGSRLYRITFLPRFRGESSQEHECLLSLRALVLSFSFFLPPLPVSLAPRTRDELRGRELRFRWGWGGVGGIPLPSPQASANLPPPTPPSLAWKFSRVPSICAIGSPLAKRDLVAFV